MASATGKLSRVTMPSAGTSRGALAQPTTTTTTSAAMTRQLSERNRMESIPCLSGAEADDQGCGAIQPKMKGKRKACEPYQIGDSPIEDSAGALAGSAS